MGKYGPFPKAWYNNLGIYKIYEESDLKENWYFFEISSHEREEKENSGNIVTIGFLRKYRKWKLPFNLIKPIFDYNTYEYNGDDYYQIPHKKLNEMNLPIRWKNYAPNNWKIAIWDTHLSICFNEAEDLLYNDNNHKPLFSLHWSFPWKNRLRTKYLLLNLDGTLYLDKTKRCGLEDVYDNQPFKAYLFKDYDGQEIIAKCTLSYSEYSLGGYSKFYRNLFKLLGNKPNIYKTLDIKFSEEVGNKKGSWKGGIVGTGIDLKPNENMDDGFKRYCEDNKITFIKEIIEK